MSNILAQAALSLRTSSPKKHRLEANTRPSSDSAASIELLARFAPETETGVRGVLYGVHASARVTRGSAVRLFLTRGEIGEALACRFGAKVAGKEDEILILGNQDSTRHGPGAGLCGPVRDGELEIGQMQMTGELVPAAEKERMLMAIGIEMRKV